MRGAAPQAARRTRNHALWIGPLLAGAGAVSYFTYFARFPALRDFPWVNLPLVGAGLAVSAAGAWRAYARPQRFRGRILGPAGLAVSGLLAGLFGFYVFGLSYRLPAPTDTTLVLERAPDLTLSDSAGRPVRLAALRGRKVVLTFYRGYW